jgi:hypothetical protein
MSWGYRGSTKPTQVQEDARMVAMDAFLDGKMTEGKQILKDARTKLSKPQAKKIARLIANEGRFDDATEVLVLSSWSAESAKEELAPGPTAKVGDILYASWGYDQTNIDYYQVVDVSGSSATIRKISKYRAPSGSTQYENAVMPDIGNFVGPPKKKRVQKSSRSDEYMLKVNDHHAWIWKGEALRETAAGYGH